MKVFSLRIFVSIFLFMVVLEQQGLFAQNLETEMRQIETLVDAGDTDRALRRYESLLQDRLEGWQKAIIQYNIGTVFLESGDTEKALERYRSIIARDVVNPLLQQRLDMNIALAKLILVEKTLENLKNNQELSTTDYGLVIADLRDTLVAISRAEQSACYLSNVEGSPVCESLPEITEMRLETKRLLSRLLTSYFDYQLKHVSLFGGSSGLLIGIDSILEEVEFLQQLPDGQPLKTQYAALFVEQMEGWDPLWEGLKDALAGLKGEKDQLENLLDQGHRDFSEGVRLLNKGNVEGSLTSFQSTKALLEEFVHHLFSQSDLKSSLDQMLILYDLVLVQDPLQERGLEVLNKAQTRLEPLVKSQMSAEVKALYGSAVEDLKVGIHAVEALQFLQGRMFVLAADNAMKSMGYAVQGQGKESPITLLEQAIELESLAFELNALKQSSEGRELSLEDSSGLLQRVQHRVFPILEKFFKAVVQQQTREFRSSLSGKSLDLRCQIFPWKQVIPLVLGGKEDAERAESLLNQSIGQAAEWQMAAIKKWKEALALLKMPKKPRDEEKQEDNKQKKEEKQQKEGDKKGNKNEEGNGGSPEKKNQGEKSDLNNVLRLLQEMEKDDRSKPKTIPNKQGQGKQPGASQEQRPW